MTRKDLPTGPIICLAGLLIALLLAALLRIAGILPDLPDWLVVMLASAALVAAALCYQQQRRLTERIEVQQQHAASALARNIQVMSAVSDVVFRCTFDGRLIYVNRAWRDITGVEPEVVQGQSILDGLHHSDRGLVEDYLAKVRAGHTDVLQTDLRLQALSGRYRWGRLTAKPYVTAESGEVIIGTLQDIQSMQEQAMIHSARTSVLDGLLGRASLRELMDKLAREWEALQAGQRVSVMLVSPTNGSLQTLAAPSMPKEYTDALNGTLPAEGVGSCGTAIARGEPVFVADVHTDPLWQDFQDLAELGSIISCWSMPFKDAEGQVLGSFAVYADQTRYPDERDLQLLGEFNRLAALVVQKSRLAEEREITEKRFSAIFQHAAVGMLLVSPTGRYISANPCYFERSGFTEEDLKHTSPQETLHPDDLLLVEQRMRNLRFGVEDRFALEVRYTRRDGHLDWINLTVTLVRDSEGVAQFYVFITEDISERKRHEASLKEAAAVFESSREGMIVIDSEFRIIRVNPAFSDITGKPAESVLGTRPLVHGRQTSTRVFSRKLLSTLANEGYWQGEVLIDRLAEQDVPMWVTATEVRDEGGEGHRYIIIFSDLSGLQRSQQQLEQMAHYDSLTGLANRTLAMSRIEQGLQRVRSAGGSLAVLYVDLDRFKAINDSLGHAVGDEVLRQAAQRLSGCCPKDDMLARLGGDEFLLILQGLQAEQVRAIGEKVCSTMRTPLVLEDGREIFIGASVGFACFPQDASTAADLVRHADAAMDTAKSIGRDQVCGYTRAMTEEASERFELERGLRKALEHHEFELHYQPLIQVRSRRAVGVEALLRWRHPERGLIPPDRFIPLAEHNGLIVQIGAWVLNEACRQAWEWHQQGLGLEKMAVNLSPRQFIQQDVVGLVRAALAASGLPASMLELEITESALMTNAQQGEQTLHDLKQLGVTLAIDDFGTGYSSLAYLRRFPLDKLKIDKSFLAGVPQRTEDNQLVTTILDMAANMGLSVVAEGVETEAQWRFLQGRGCGVCQGFLFSKALPAAELPAWLDAQ